MLPLSVVFVSMITFNNLTLKFLGVAFYNVGRSLTTVFNVVSSIHTSFLLSLSPTLSLPSLTFSPSLTPSPPPLPLPPQVFSYAVLGQTISCRVLTCCGIIVLGFSLGLKEEHSSLDNSNDRFSLFGVGCGVLASLSVALYAIYTKRVLPLVDNNIWRLQFYNNANAVVLLFPLVFVMREFEVLRSFKYWTYSTFWGLLIAAGVFGIAIGYVTALQIQVTSPLTHNVSGTAKAGAQTVLACVVYSQSRQLWWWVSNVLVLAGSSAYTYVRMSDMKNSNTTEQEEGEGGGVNKTLRILEGDSENGSTTASRP